MSYEYSNYKTKFETELEEDLPAIIHCLTAEVKTEEQSNDLSSALYGWECKYGFDLLNTVEDLISDMSRHLIENCGFETFEEN
jgi:hypothetical protein